MRLNPTWRLAATGFGVIAVCYGFARFAFGLFLPQIDAELSLSSMLAGLMSAGSFLAYCLAIVVAAAWTERAGPRTVTLMAAVLAAAGMAGMAWAPSPGWLSLAVMVGGASTGLVSPPLAAAVASIVAAPRQGRVNTVINAGTSGGVLLCAPVALLLGEHWRLAYVGFAVVAGLLAVATVFSVPAQDRAASAQPRRWPAVSGALRRLIVAAFLAGAASTAVWSFGGQLVALHLTWDSRGAGLLWFTLGVAGLGGAATGAWVGRFGMAAVHRASLAALAAGLLAIGLGGTTPMLTLSGGLLFGVAYMTLTGVYLIWGVSALPARPATGLTVGFLALAVGQAAGAPLFGLLLDTTSATTASGAFAGLTLLAAAICAERKPGRRGDSGADSASQPR